jgi:hypothetical protein
VEETNQCGQSVIVVGGCLKDQVIEVEALSYLETQIFTRHIEEGSSVGLDPSEKYKIAREHLNSNIILFLLAILFNITLSVRNNKLEVYIQKITITTNLIIYHCC